MLNFLEAWKWPGREEILEFTYLMPLHMSTIYSMLCYKIELQTVSYAKRMY